MKPFHREIILIKLALDFDYYLIPARRVYERVDCAWV